MFQEVFKSTEYVSEFCGRSYQQSYLCSYYNIEFQYKCLMIVIDNFYVKNIALERFVPILLLFLFYSLIKIALEEEDVFRGLASSLVKFTL